MKFKYFISALLIGSTQASDISDPKDKPLTRSSNGVHTHPTTGEDFKEKAEKDLYKQGLTHRDAGRTEMAINCFLPLAKKGYAKAQHNLGTRYYKLGNERKAYKWLKRASEQGLTASQNNLKRMNLLYLLLPDEILCHATSFLGMKELFSFKLVSQRARDIVHTTITDTDFLNSERPYATDIAKLWREVTFEPQPSEIKLARFAKSSDSSIGIHFRDSQHLRNIVNQIPIVQAKSKTYFVRDPEVENGKEIVPINGKDLEIQYFLHIIGDKHLKLAGSAQIPCLLVLPQQADTNELNLTCKSMAKGDAKALQNGQVLADAIDTFNEELYRIRTSDAVSLLEERKKQRNKNPEYFPNLADACPTNYLLLSDSEIQVVQKDYIVAHKPFIYIANSITGLKELCNNLPDFSQAISFVDPERHTPGVFCNGPLYLNKGFEISTQGHLTLTGSIILPHYNLLFKGKKGFWSFGLNMHGLGITMKSGGSAAMYGLNTYMYNNTKPDNMPQEEWDRFLAAALEHGYISLP